MIKTEVQKFINHPHIYMDITDEEQDAIAVPLWLTIVDGVKYVGTNDPVEALKDKEVI